MAAPKGNKFWEARSSHGRNPVFSNPNDLWDACCQYFQWVEDNPLSAAELVKYQGKAKLSYVPKMRAMTEVSLCIFLGITFETWSQYKKNKDFSDICNNVVDIIKTQKFQGASADMLNPSIIARDLGLTDKQDIGFGENGLESINITFNRKEKAGK